MSDLPFDGQPRECPRCGSIAVVEDPGRSRKVRHDGLPLGLACTAGWRCDGCGHVEPWYRHREELKATLQSLRSRALELSALMPYTVAGAREIAAVVVSLRVAADAQMQLPDAIPDQVKVSLVLRFREMLDSCLVLDRADFTDHDRIRSAALTLLDRAKEVERLLAVGLPGTTDADLLDWAARIPPGPEVPGPA